MADLKISALTSASTPLAGTEVLPIVQSGSTVKVAVSNLTAGRAVATGVLTSSVTGTTDKIAQFNGQNANNYIAIYDGSGTSATFGSISGGNPYIFGGVGKSISLYAGAAEKVRVNDTGNIVMVNSGNGIDFSATPGTGTSEVLSDYEEGTYTAVLTPQTSGTIPLNSSYDTLAYTKVGRLVTITGQIQTFSPSSPVGTYFTLNIPFAIADLTELSGRGGFMLNYQSTAISTLWSEGDSIIYINKNASTVLNAENLYISFSYFAA